MKQTTMHLQRGQLHHFLLVNHYFGKFWNLLFQMKPFKWMKFLNRPSASTAQQVFDQFTCGTHHDRALHDLSDKLEYTDEPKTIIIMRPI